MRTHTLVEHALLSKMREERVAARKRREAQRKVYAYEAENMHWLYSPERLRELREEDRNTP